MTTLLAIEAATDACSVAITHQGVVTERYQLAARRHAENILPMIDDLCSAVSVALQDIQAIAFGAGPGSFLGSRLAAGVTQGLAYALQCPVIRVSTLQALAQGMMDEAGSMPVIAAWDARMGEVYWGRYAAVDGVMQPLADDCVSSPADCLAALPEAPIVLAGNAWAAYADTFTAQALGGRVIQSDVYPHAAGLTPAALLKWHVGETLPAEQACPVYLREPVTK